MAALGNDIAGQKTAVFLPQPEVRGDIGGIADFLEGQDIRPEGIDIAVILFGEQFAQGEAGIEKKIFPLFLAPVLIDLGVIVIAEDVTGHGRDTQAGLFIDVRNPLGHLNEPVLFHVFVDELHAAGGAGHGKQGLFLIMPEGAVEILHHHSKPRIVMPLLLGDHELQGERRRHRLPTLDGTDSAHKQKPP